MSYQQAEDHHGNLYEVTDDHAQARRVFAPGDTGAWEPMASIRMAVGPLRPIEAPRG